MKKPIAGIVKYKDTVEWSEEAKADKKFADFHIKRCGKGPFEVVYVERAARSRIVTVKLKDGDRFTANASMFRVVKPVSA